MLIYIQASKNKSNRGGSYLDSPEWFKKITRKKKSKK